MKLTTTIFAIAALTSTTALPSWRHGHKDKEIPSLSVQEWQSIQTGHFKGLKTENVNEQGWVTKIADLLTSPSISLLDELCYLIPFVAVAPVDDPKDDKSIYAHLLEQPDKYSKIVKLLDLEETGKAKKVLDDKEESITFFAPENSGLPDHHHHHHHDGDDDDDESLFEALVAEPSAANLLKVHHRYGHSLTGGDDDDDDDKKKRRRKIFQFILRSVLMYHGLPEALSATDLAGNSSLATVLKPKFGANDGEPLRIHVEKKLVPPSLEINFYAKILSSTPSANGFLHSLSHPLIPPPSILDEAFLFPKRFSILTTALQKIGAQSAVEWGLDLEKTKKKHKPVFKGSPALTLFAPTNEAFALLPDKLLMFLFSPFGQRALQKILAYHVLPKHVLFSESLHEVGKGHKHHKHHHRHQESVDPSFHLELELPTLLEKANLKLVIDKSRVVPIPGAVKWTVTVNSIPVSTIDVPALNGVLHVLPEVLVPPHKHHHHHDDGEDGLVVGWEDWEDWLVDWAEEE